MVERDEHLTEGIELIEDNILRSIKHEEAEAQGISVKELEEDSPIQILLLRLLAGSVVISVVELAKVEGIREAAEEIAALTPVADLDGQVKYESPGDGSLLDAPEWLEAYADYVSTPESEESEHHDQES